MAGTPLSAPIEMRARWYLQVDKYDKTVTDVCGIFGISRKTYYKWYNLDHYLTKRTGVRRGLHPHTKLIPAIQQIVYACKIKYNYGPAKMQVFLRDTQGVRVSTTAIYKYYKKRRLIRKPQKKQPWYMPLREPYTATIPGENVQLDVKYVPGPDRSWRYQYRFVDTVTNMQFATETEYKDAESTIAVLKRACRSFPFPILGIQTDNGSEFRGSFHLYLLHCRIVHRYIPKRSAPWNGKVERANRSIDDEYYLNPHRPWTSLSQYTHWYNHERYHLGKNMAGLTPYQKYLSLAKVSVTLEG